MGKYRALIPLGVALIVAVITSILVYQYLQQSTKATVVQPETQVVAAAVADIGWGSKLTKEMIKEALFLKNSLPPGSFSDADSLVGRVAVSPIKANEPILESRLAPASVRTGGVAAVINPKKRAVAIKVDKVIGVSGFIRQGNRVDVLVTIPTGKTTDPMTKTVLENILVLTVGPDLEKKGKDEKPSEVDVITLEVTPEEAEKLALSATEGKLQLALRNFTDTEDVTTRGATIPTLLASYSGGAPTGRGTGGRRPTGEKRRVEKPGVEKPRVEKPRVVIVELVKGGKLTEIKFERSE